MTTPLFGLLIHMAIFLPPNTLEQTTIDQTPNIMEFKTLPAFINSGEWFLHLQRAGYSVTTTNYSRNNRFLQIYSPEVESDRPRGFMKVKLLEKITWSVWLTANGPVGHGVVYEHPIIGPWR